MNDNTIKIFATIKSGCPDTPLLSGNEIADGTIGEEKLDKGLKEKIDNKGNIAAVDVAEELEDIETNVYLKYVTQSLTESQKMQTRNNIGAASTEYVLALFNELKAMILSGGGGGGGVVMPDAILDNAILNNAKLV